MAKVIDIDDHGQTLEDIKFKLKINKDQAEEIMSYNQLMDYIQKGTDAEEDPDSLFKFRDIVAHQGPLESTDPNHKGSKYNVMVEWESGEVTYEPLTLISKDDPITCAVYAKKHDLLDTTGWKHLKRFANELYSFFLYTLYLYVYMSTYLAGLVNDVRMHYPDTF